MTVLGREDTELLVRLLSAIGLFAALMAAFAQFDNDVRSDRTRAGMRAALELGRWLVTELGLRTRRGLVLSPQSFGQMLRKVRPSTDALERFAQATRTRLRIIFEPEAAR